MDRQWMDEPDLGRAQQITNERYNEAQCKTLNERPVISLYTDLKVTFAVEPLMGDDFEKFKQLQSAHYQEVVGFRAALDRLNPDWDKYVALEKNGRLHLVKARAYDGTLVGYSAHLVYTHLHYKHVLVAEDDVFYVVPAMRNRGVGKAMRAFACETLKDRGVKLVLAREKPTIPHTHLQKLGYALMEHVYAKVL